MLGPQGRYDRPANLPAGAFWWTGNTATYAVQAAALLGFRDIRLLGVDLVYRVPGQSDSHCWGDGKKEGCRLGDVSLILKVFARIRKDIEKRGGTLVNESPIKGPLDSVLPRRECPCLMK
jgi:hypothetical protein